MRGHNHGGTTRRVSDWETCPCRQHRTRWWVSSSPTTTSRVWIHGRLLQIKNLLSTEKCSWSEWQGRERHPRGVPRARFRQRLEAQFSTLVNSTPIALCPKLLGEVEIAKKGLGGDKEVLRNALQRRFREGYWKLSFSCCSLVDSYVYSKSRRKVYLATKW